MAEATCEFTWTCQRCACVVQIKAEASSYMDVTPVPPNGWDYAADENTHCCAECLEKERAALTVGAQQ